jgi:hypothetical protein
MLISFDGQGLPYVSEALRLIPEINKVVEKRPAYGKAILLYIACMTDYESPFLVRYPEFDARKEAVLKAYRGRKIGGGEMEYKMLTTIEVEAAMRAYHAYQKSSMWDFYYALEKKIAECDEVLGTIKVNLSNVDEQQRMVKLRKEAYLSFEDVKRQILTKVTTKSANAGKAKAYQLRDIQFVK